MKVFLEKIRMPQKGVTSKYILTTVGFMLFGFALGVFQKWIDGTASNYFPMIFQQLFWQIIYMDFAWNNNISLF